MFSPLIAVSTYRLPKIDFGVLRWDIFRYFSKIWSGEDASLRLPVGFLDRGRSFNVERPGGPTRPISTQRSTAGQDQLKKQVILFYLTL